MSGPRWCCCPNCIVFADYFDRCNPPLDFETGGCPDWYVDCEDNNFWFESCPPIQTGYYAFPYDEVPIPTQEFRPVWWPQGDEHEWWVYVSRTPQYPGDGALYEVSGEGEIWCRAGWQEDQIMPDQGYAVMMHTVAEVPNSTYRIFLCLTIDGDASGDALILEFNNGDWTVDPFVDGYIKILTRINGVEVEVKTRTIITMNPITFSDPWSGRWMTFRWMPDLNYVCGSVGSFDMYTGAQICAVEQTFVDAGTTCQNGHNFGIGNSSGLDGNGDPISIVVDNVVFYRQQYRGADGEDLTLPSTKQFPCFSCNCLCMHTLLDSALFPNHFRLHAVVTLYKDPVIDPSQTEICQVLDDYFDLYNTEECGGNWTSGRIDYNDHDCEWIMRCPPGIGGQINGPYLYVYEEGVPVAIYPMDYSPYTWENIQFQCKPYYLGELQVNSSKPGVGGWWPGSLCGGKAEVHYTIEGV